MDWLDCGVIERQPGKMSGASVIRGSRVRPTDVLNNIDLPPDEIAASFNLRRQDVEAVLDFFRQHEAELTTG